MTEIAMGAVSGTNYVGGVAGRNTGMVQNCVALSASVTGSSNVGCVQGNAAGTMSNNYAKNDMGGTTAQFTAKAHDGKDGADVGFFLSFANFPRMLERE